MNFGKALKMVEFNLLQQSGIQVTPEQLGIKPGDMAANALGGLGSSTGSFASVLGGLKMPTPPTPPADPANMAQQDKYNRELLAYNQQMFTQNQQFFRQMMMQMSQLQQASFRQNSQPTSASSIGSSFSATGGILDSSPDI